MNDIRFGKRITTQVFYDGQLVATLTDNEVENFTDRNTMLRDVIDALAVLTNGSTNKLELCIIVDKKGRFKLSKKWGEA